MRLSFLCVLLFALRILSPFFLYITSPALSYRVPAQQRILCRNLRWSDAPTELHEVQIWWRNSSVICLSLLLCDGTRCSSKERGEVGAFKSLCAFGRGVLGIYLVSTRFIRSNESHPHQNSEYIRSLLVDSSSLNGEASAPNPPQTFWQVLLQFLRTVYNWTRVYALAWVVKSELISHSPCGRIRISLCALKQMTCHHEAVSASGPRSLSATPNQ